MCQIGGCSCRYDVKYTRGVIEKGEERGELSDLQIDKVAAQKDIAKKKLGEDDIPDGLRIEIRDELGNINRRWESSREEDEKQRGMHLLTSQEWVDMETGAREGIPPLRWGEWMNKHNEDQWEWLGSVEIFHRRRPVVTSTDVLGGEESKRKYRSVAKGDQREI